MKREAILASNLKERLEQKNCRGLVVFTNAEGQVTMTATQMSKKCAVGLLTAQIFDLARALEIKPQKLLEYISDMLDECEPDLEKDFKLVECAKPVN